MEIVKGNRVLRRPPPLTNQLVSDSDVNLIRRIADYEKISGVIWIVVGVIQILLVLTLIAGVWNVFAGISRLNVVKRIKAQERSVVENFEGIAGLVVIGIINLIFGGVLGILFIGFDFFIRDQVLSNSRLFNNA